MILNKFSFLNKYAALLGLFKDNTQREITEATMREFAQDAGDSVMFLTDHAYESFFAVASGTNNYVATPFPVIGGYTIKQRFYIRFTNANTGACTIDLGYGPLAIKKSGSQDLSSGDISAGQILILVYDGSNFQLIGGSGSTISNSLNSGLITIELYNGGQDLTTGIKDVPVKLPYSGVVTGWEIMAYNSSNVLTSASCVVDILSDTFANLPLSGSDSIAGTEKPSLSSQSTNSDYSITTWGNLVEGNYIQAEIESVSAGVARIVICITVDRTS
ncbi:MAG: hypothetical protein KatS3mg031_2942 [Chitinophagales bacterium]|nr:MAG: hypothetical protein KatS3mg031_2942 [Chitinophagales bacterium]